MTPSDLEKAKTLVLDYHRKVLNNEPRLAASLVGTSSIQSLDDLDTAYAELLKQGIASRLRSG